MQITNILNPNNTLSVNRPLAHKIGLNAAIIYTALIAKQAYYEARGMLDSEGFFYSTIDDLQESTTLSHAQQQRAIEVLVQRGLIEYRLMKMPAKRYFRVIDDENLLTSLLGTDNQVYEEAVNKVTENSKTSFSENANQVYEETVNKVTENSKTSFSENANHTYKTKENKTKVINPNPSTAPCGAADGGTERVKRVEDREKIFSRISDNIESFPDEEGVSELAELMTDVICSERQTVRVNGSELPLEQVKRRFLELRREHIESVLETLEKNSGEVRNRRAYLITLLYNAVPKKSKSDSEFEYDEYGMQTSSITDEMVRRVLARYN